MILSFFKQLAPIFTWIVVVAPWEEALRVRLGKRVKKLSAGTYLKIPFIDRVFKQSVRRRLNLIRPQTLTTKDGKVVTCSASVGFSIGDLEKLYNTIEAPNDTIENEVAAIVSKFVGERNLAECSLAILQKYVMENIDLSKYGLVGQEFYITSFATTSRTYRLITGDLGSWQQDARMTMNGDNDKNYPY